MNEIETVKQEVMPLPEQAKAIIVKDQQSLSRANEFFLIIKGLRKKIATSCDPVIKKTNDAHKEALKQKSDLEAPLIEAERYLNGQVTTYTLEQERIRREEEEIQRQEAIKAESERRKIAEKERLAQAVELEKAGAKEEAEALIAETVENNEKPIDVYIPPPATPQAKLSGAVVKEYWSAQVFDLKALCKAVADGKAPLAYVEANMPTLNTLARRLMKELDIPGVKAVSMSSVAATGGRK